MAPGLDLWKKCLKLNHVFYLFIYLIIYLFIYLFLFSLTVAWKSYPAWNVDTLLLHVSFIYPCFYLVLIIYFLSASPFQSVLSLAQATLVWISVGAATPSQDDE